MSIYRKFLLGAATLLVAGVASANTFRAADLVYLPALARLQGGGGAFFKTDVVIANLSSDRIVVDVVYIPTGAGTDNSGAISTFTRLPVLAPGERRVLNDFVQTGLNRADANGMALFFACRENGNCNNCDANSADCRLISVSGRIYNDQPSGTFGQLFPGLPWYNYASIDAAQFGFQNVVINGARQDANFRTNIGVVNSSAYSSTTLRLSLFSPTAQLLGQTELTLAPLAHSQQAITNFFPGFTGNGYVVVEQVAFTPKAGVTDAAPGFFAYGSTIDGRTGDPTTLEAIFDEPLDAGCVFGSKPISRGVRR